MQNCNKNRADLPVLQDSNFEFYICINVACVFKNDKKYTKQTKIFPCVKGKTGGKLSHISGKAVENLVEKVERTEKRLENSRYYSLFSLAFPHVENFFEKTVAFYKLYKMSKKGLHT